MGNQCGFPSNFEMLWPFTPRKTAQNGVTANQIAERPLVSPGGGVTTIYEGTGCATFWGAFFPVENKFWGIIFGKITSSHKFWGVILKK